jgi:predicted dehydrogenase
MSATDGGPVRVGILSTAHLHAEAYAAQLTGLEGAEFAGVADADDERGRSFADSHGVPYEDTADLLASVDGVVVCSTNADHREWVERAAEAGVEVLSEKPLAPNVDDARAIVETCEAAGVDLGVAMPLRFSVPARRAGERLEAGDLGTLQAVVGTNRGQMPGDWFVDPDAAGGGAAMDHTVHIVDLVHWLTDQRVEEVYAELGTQFHDVPVEDLNVLSMTLEDGTQFSLDGSWSRPDSWDFWGDATVSLVGTEATIDVNCFDQKLKHTSDSDGEIRSVYWGTDPNEGLVVDFVEGIRENRPPETTGWDGVEAVAVVEAVYESAERGEPVQVEYRD